MTRAIAPPIAGTWKTRPLADLWGIAPAEERSADGSPVPSIAERGTELRLGDGPALRTSGGLVVHLPGDDAGRRRWVCQLEAWAAQLLAEAYRAPATRADSWALRAYYRVRPIMPRGVQLTLRRLHARQRQRSASHLRWPIEPLFVGIAEAYLALRIQQSDERAIPLSPRWPRDFVAAVALTHDVEGPAGQARCRDVMALERKVGVRSCFNFVAERYPLDHALMDEMRSDGFEIGSHGIKHDGRKFSSREIFEQRLDLLRRYQQEWRVAGFRSPATHRRWDWMPELPFEYDSSYPDTDPFEPIPGGCGSPWPFRIGPLVELPVTMPQDHTLWEILRTPALPVWREKLDWLRGCGGLATVIVHPDYLTSDARWQEYERLLEDLAGRADLWVALPRAVARWWLERHTGAGLRATLSQVDGGSRLVFSGGAE
jgi:peptidoglycan/xylan/chitin deacetylase (PgdA/CDA1 family)